MYNKVKMRKVGKISVLIVTCNRPGFLKDCLKSLKSQICLPNQVLVVDNGNGEKALKIVKNFKKDLPIDYVFEKIKGEAFARNRALKFAKGDILVFIDDDCLADKNWLKTIADFFQQNHKSDGLVGKVENRLKENPFANIYQCYYLRWLMENFSQIDKIQPLTEEKSFFDTKNVAFRRKLIGDFAFDPDVLFHSVNVDNVAGDLLVKKGKFFYHPQMIIFHQNWGSFKELLVKNFFQGVADEWIRQKQGIENRQKPLPYSYVNWLKICLGEIKDLIFFQKFVFWPMLFFYPLPYKIGRLAFKLKKYQ